MIKIKNMISNASLFRHVSHRTVGFIGVACLFLAAAIAHAQFKPPKMLTAIAGAPRSVEAGKTFTVSLTVTIDKPYHIQANPTKDGFIPTELTLGKVKGFKLGKITYPKATQANIAGDILPVYEDKVEIKADIAADKTVKPGAFALPLTLKYQGCNDKACFPPGSVAVPVSISISKGAAKMSGSK